MTDPLEQAMQDDWERRENCHHDHTMTYDDTLYCFDCNSVIAVTCWNGSEVFSFIDTGDTKIYARKYQHVIGGG